MAKRSTRQLIRDRVKVLKACIGKLYKYPKELEELSQGRSQSLNQVIPIIVEYLQAGEDLCEKVYKTL